MFSNFLTFSVTDGGRRTERDDDGTAARYYPSRHVPFATLCVAGATMTPSLDGSAKVIEDHDVCLLSARGKGGAFVKRNNRTSVAVADETTKTSLLYHWREVPPGPGPPHHSFTLVLQQSA